VKAATKLQPPDAWLLSFPQFHALYQFRVDGAEFGYSELGQGINNMPQLRSHIHRRTHALPPEFKFGFPLLESLDMSLNRLITLDHIGDWYPTGLKERQPAVLGRFLLSQIVLYVVPLCKHVFLSLGIPGFCVCGGIIKESLDRRQYVLPHPVCVVPVRMATITSKILATPEVGHMLNAEDHTGSAEATYGQTREGVTQFPPVKPPARAPFVDPLHSLPEIAIHDSLVAGLDKLFSPGDVSQVDRPMEHTANGRCAPPLPGRRGNAALVEFLGDQFESVSLGSPLEGPAHPAGLIGNNDQAIAVFAVPIRRSAGVQARPGSSDHAKSVTAFPRLILDLADDPAHGFDDETRVGADGQVLPIAHFDGLVQREYLHAMLAAESRQLSAQSIGAPKAVIVPADHQVYSPRFNQLDELAVFGAVADDLVEPVVVAAVPFDAKRSDNNPAPGIADLAADLELLGNAILLLGSLSPGRDGGDYDGTQVALPIIVSGVIIIWPAKCK